MDLKIGNFSLNKLKLENIYSAYYGMTPREQTVALALCAFVIIIAILLPITLAGGRISRLESDVVAGRKQLNDIVFALENYDLKRAKLAQKQQLLSSGFDSAISTTLETLAEETGIKDKIDSLKEKPVTNTDAEVFEESSVDVRLKKISLQELVKYLSAIENHPQKMLQLKKLSVKPRFDNKKQLDVSFTVSTYKLLEEVQEGT